MLVSFFMPWTFYVQSCANSPAEPFSSIRSAGSPEEEETQRAHCFYQTSTLDAVQTHRQTDRIMLVICSFESSNLSKHSLRSILALSKAHWAQWTSASALQRAQSSSINCLTGRTCLLKAHLLSFLSSLAFRRATSLWKASSLCMCCSRIASSCRSHLIAILACLKWCRELQVSILSIRTCKHQSETRNHLPKMYYVWDTQTVNARQAPLSDAEFAKFCPKHIVYHSSYICKVLLASKAYSVAIVTYDSYAIVAIIFLQKFSNSLRTLKVRVESARVECFGSKTF